MLMHFQVYGKEEAPKYPDEIETPIDKCTLCRQDIGIFRDGLAKIEYSKSGLCQSCQDDVFNA